MERSQLLYVIRVAETENITHAANNLHLSQPSLSNQIINLERELGVHLFERSRKRISMTQAGEIFVYEAKQILKAMDNLQETMMDFSQRRLGKLRIGALSTMTFLGLPDRIAEFSGRYPKLELKLDVNGSADLIEKVKTNELDAAFAILPKSHKEKELTCINYRESRFMAVVNRQNPLAAKKTLTMESFRNQQLIVSSSSFNLQRLILEKLNQKRIPYRIFSECNQIETCFVLTAKNFGISFCSEEISNNYKNDHLVFIPIQGIPVRTIYLIYKKDPMYHPALQAFVDFFQAEVQMDVNL